MTLLNPGDRFPDLDVTLIDGETLRLPDALAGSFGVVLFYRGSWCPYCKAQLRAFQRSLDALGGVEAKVVALSVDDEATTKDLVTTLRLDFPVGHSADPDLLARTTGAFVNDDPGTSSRPASCSTPPGGSSSASTPAARSAASCPTTSSA